MTRIFTEGFEAGDLSFFVGGGAASTAAKRSGVYSAAITSYTPAGAGQRNISPISEFYLRFGVLMPGSSTVVVWRKGSTTLGSIAVNSISRLIEVYTSTGTLVATGTHMINPNVWYLIELYIKIADAGTITVKTDGIQDSTFSGDTKPGTDTTVDNLLFYAQGGYQTWYYDDIALNDTTGSSDNSWCGDGKVLALIPNGNGDLSQLTNSAGNNTNNYSYVDEKPSNTTDYVEGSVVDEKDLYALSNTGFTNETILRVWGESRSLDTVANGGLIAFTFKTHGTEYDSEDVQLMNTYTQVLASGTVFKLNPYTGVAWTISELDDLQMGPKTRS